MDQFCHKYFKRICIKLTLVWFNNDDSHITRCMVSNQFSLEDHIDRELVKVTKFLINNPGLHKERIYEFHQIIDLPRKFTLDSQQLFGIMSSALSLNKSMREKFFEDHPCTLSYFSTLGPNRLQYAMLAFNFLCRIDQLIEGIIEWKIREVNDSQKIMKLYDKHEEFRFRKAIFLGSSDPNRVRIILHDPDPRIQKLRHSL